MTESRKRMIPKEWKELERVLEGTKSTRTRGGKAGCPDGRSDLRQGAEAGTNKLHSGNNNQGLWECKRSPRGGEERREDGWRARVGPGGGPGVQVEGYSGGKKKKFWKDYPGRWSGDMIQVVF